MTTITKIVNFEAAHHLPYHLGKCHSLHGHSYKLEVTVSGNVFDVETPSGGMIMDFADLKDIIERVVVDKYDHSNLNEYFFNPTAELMVTQIYYDIKSALPIGVKLKSCRLWETSTSYAEYSAD